MVPMSQKPPEGTWGGEEAILCTVGGKHAGYAET